MAKEKTFKPGAYVCIVDNGFAYFNKKTYTYGDRIICDSEEVFEKMMGSGKRFVPEAEFEKEEKGVVARVYNARSNQQSIEDVIRESKAEQDQIRAEYEAKIAELQKAIEASKVVPPAEEQPKKEAKASK